MNLDTLTEGFEDGMIATMVMSVPMLLATVTGKSPMPEPFPKAIVDRVVGEDASKLLTVPLTVAAHQFYGGSNGAVLAAFGGPVTTRTGLEWGVALWGIMQVGFMPFVGWGLFGRNLSESRKVSIVTLGLHLVYGGTLGGLLERDGEKETSSRGQRESVAESERRDGGRDERLVDLNVEW